MLRDNDRISNWQTIVLLVSAINAIGILNFPQEYGDIVGSGAVFGIILGHILAGIAMVVIIYLGQRFPQETIFEYGQHIVGTFASKLIGLAFVFVWILTTARMTRSFADFIKIWLLPQTPIEIIIFLFFVVSAYIIRHGIEPIVRTMEILFYLFILVSIVLIIVGITETEFMRLLPLFDQGLYPIVEVTWEQAKGLEGVELFLLILPFLLFQEKARTLAIVGISITMTIRVIFFVISFAIFGEKIVDINFPVMAIVRVAELPGGIWDRPEGVFAAIWITVTFTSVMAFYFFSAAGLSRLFALKSHIPAISFLLPVLYVVSLLPENVIEVGQFSEYTRHMYSLLLYGIPGLLLIICWVRKIDHRNKQKGKDAVDV